jgi:hypothetical protein
MLGALLFASLLCVSLTFRAQTTRPAWEYKVIHISMDERSLNTFGGDGWELVAIDSEGRDKVYYFKRPK